ncbi:MAG: DUF1499 domain-containing protein [Syntrophaceae bacterium]|nr:DUF1499 domain-containing protein [Syntrophaceae bacterium]
MRNVSVFSIVFVLIALSGNADVAARPDTVSLPPCPDKPNCVSSLSTDNRHAIEPLRYHGSRERAQQKLLEVIGSWKRARVVAIKGNRIQTEFTSALFRFVDDVDFLFDDTDKTIHVRSASRVGWLDLGVNRRRVEGIRKLFVELSEKEAKP